MWSNSRWYQNVSASVAQEFYTWHSIHQIHHSTVIMKYIRDTYCIDNFWSVFLLSKVCRPFQCNWLSVYLPDTQCIITNKRSTILVNQVHAQSWFLASCGYVAGLKSDRGINRLLVLFVLYGQCTWSCDTRIQWSTASCMYHVIVMLSWHSYPLVSISYIPVKLKPYARKLCIH